MKRDEKWRNVQTVAVRENLIGFTPESLERMGFGTWYTIKKKDIDGVKDRQTKRTVIIDSKMPKVYVKQNSYKA